MKKIVAFGGSNSKNSINKALAHYAAGQVENTESILLDLNDYELPIYSIDHEKEQGIPENAHQLLNQIKEADGLIVSLAEHNGCYTAAFKNAYDWMSRIDKSVWQNKPMLLMATSPGARGGATVLQIAKTGFPFLGGNIVADFSLAKFHENFAEEGIQDGELAKQFSAQIEALQAAL